VRLIDDYVAHRRMRDQQILAAFEAGARTAEGIVARVYPNLSPSLRQAAAESVSAHLIKLKEEGKLQAG
jgi:hypothetical protein